jgi:hypothetical protein
VQLGLLPVWPIWQASFVGSLARWVKFSVRCFAAAVVLGCYNFGFVSVAFVCAGNACVDVGMSAVLGAGFVSTVQGWWVAGCGVPAGLLATSTSL